MLLTAPGGETGLSAHVEMRIVGIYVHNGGVATKALEMSLCFRDAGRVIGGWSGVAKGLRLVNGEPGEWKYRGLDGVRGLGAWWYVVGGC
jgi:hypothetical protein